MFDQTKHCTTLRISASSFRGSKAFSNPWPRTFIVLQYAMVLKKKISEIICQLIRSAATRTLFLGGKICFWGGQNFWVGLLFSEFSVDLKKKKVISPNCSIYLLDFCRFPKKKATLLKLPPGKEEFGWAF